EARAGKSMRDELQRAGAAAGFQPAVGTLDLRVVVGRADIAGLGVGRIAGYARGQLEAPALLRRVAHPHLDVQLHAGRVGGVTRQEDRDTSAAAIELGSGVALCACAGAVAGSAGEPRVGS